MSDALRAWLKQQRIVCLERRHGDGRNWANSYDAQRELTDEQIIELIGVLRDPPERYATPEP